MLRPKRKINGINDAGRISSVLVAGWLIIGWSRPAFPDEGQHLKFAPIQISSNVGGDIGYTFLSYDFGTTKTTSQALDVRVDYDLGVKSFFWQPWFAQVSADLGVGLYGDATRQSPSSNKSGNTLLKGDADLDMLKYSRFPFNAHVYDGKQHASGNTVGINSDFRSNGYDLTQKYKSPRGSLDSSATFSHNENGRVMYGTEEIRNQLYFDLTAVPVDLQTLHVVGNFTDLNQPIRNQSLIVDTVVANHYYQPNSAFGIASLLNLLKNNITYIPTNSTPLQNDYSSQQFSSYASWRPIGNPLTVTSGLLLLRSEASNSNSLPIGFNNTNFNLGANYAWSTLIRAYGSVNVNDSSAIQTVSTSAALAAQKIFGEVDAVNLGGFKYNRYAAISIGNATVTSSTPLSTPGGTIYTTTTSVQSLGVNLGHDLSKNTNVSNGLLTTDLYQRYSEVLSTRRSPNSNLNSGVSLTWRLSAGRESTLFSFRADDSRTLTGDKNFGQIINLQATRNVNLLRHQSLNGNLTIQSSRSEYYGISNPFVTTPSANLGYRNERLFAVKNLSFSSDLNIYGNNIMSSQSELNTSNYAMAKVSWDNRLDYYIGRVRMKLYSNISEVNNGLQSSLYFNVMRSF